MGNLVGELFDGPVDVIGDIHGEYQALVRLLELLGYDQSGAHPEGRRIVFLGDLVDRGEDSPAVMELAMDYVNSGRAQCVLGNHELMILYGRYGHGNGWFLDPPLGTEPEAYRSKRVDPGRRQAYLDFFDAQPVVLANGNLRIVHACWDDPAVQRLRGLNEEPASVATHFRSFDDATRTELEKDAVLAAALRRESEAFDYQAGPDAEHPSPLPAHAAAELAMLHNNPMKVLTLGRARAATLPYFGAGRWRNIERIPWWASYRDETPVIIGHFWREFSALVKDRSGIFGQDVLAGVAPHDWMGLRHNVYCVDYSVGKRYRARQNRTENGGKLAAVRYPEWQVFHDDGAVVDIGQPGLEI